jgi:hypothetical protein
MQKMLDRQKGWVYLRTMERTLIQLPMTCSSCGSTDQSQLKICHHCPVPLCNNCRIPHESVCEEVQKLKAMGRGATIRRKAGETVCEHGNPPFECFSCKRKKV